MSANAQSRDLASVIFDMESYVHRTVALADAVRTMGCAAPGTLNPAAVEAVAEALGDAAESVREHWREAFRLAHPDGQA
jgi:hypothetical protein